MLENIGDDSLCVLLDESNEPAYIFYLSQFEKNSLKQKILPVVIRKDDGYDFYYGSPIKIDSDINSTRVVFMSDLMFAFENWRTEDGLTGLYTLDIVLGNLDSYIYRLVPSEKATELILQAWRMYKRTVGIH